MDALKIVSLILTVTVLVCCAYQTVYIPIPWLFFKKKRPKETDKRFSYAVLVCARNEEAVIADLIDSLHRQTYGTSLLHIFVMADNCTDRTAAVAKEAGATVYVRNDNEHVGKGYAMDALMGHIREDFPSGFDGYFVFDADNLLRPDYIEQMNKTFAEGHDVVTSYRNSKNFGDNWISAGTALWFLRESRYLNHARYLLGVSCAVSGTGFLFSRKVADELCGWPFHTLTEDIEFTIRQITKGRKVAFCADAELFDEQPTALSQSMRQRTRWIKGSLQVFSRSWKKLAKGAFTGNFACYDMAMNILSAWVVSLFSLVLNTGLTVFLLCRGEKLAPALLPMGTFVLFTYLSFFFMGLITVVTEWKHIHASTGKKLLYAFTFPLFMATYIPLAVTAFFAKPEWKPIVHSVSLKRLRERADVRGNDLPEIVTK